MSPLDFVTSAFVWFSATVALLTALSPKNGVSWQFINLSIGIVGLIAGIHINGWLK